MDTPTITTAQQQGRPYMPFQNQNQEVTFGEWMITLLLTYIPLVNIIMLFVWAFGSTTNPSKANWAKATLLWMAIGIVVVILFLVLIGTALFHGLQGMD